MKKLCVIFPILFIKISAQSEIKGILFSDDKTPIVRANIILLNTENDIETFGFSDKAGSFLVSTDKLGIFKLQLRSLNFHEKEIELKISEKNQKVDLGKIEIVKLKEHEIREVVITRQNPIRIKKDTVEYSADKFATGTEMNVEDLLKKLPGVTVDSQGKIKFGNKEVERVTVENDDLFERGYQTLTQNMPSQSIDKVQVLKNYSKNKLLKNVEDSERIAINLTLKEEAKGKWFGNTILASTSYVEKMHQLKVNVMNFSKRRKFYLLYNRNNLGLNEMSGVEYLINPAQENDVENLGENLRTYSIIQLHQKNRQFEDNRTNFNNDQLASLNYIYNFRNDWKLKFVTIYNDIENRNFIDNVYNFNYNGLKFINTEYKTWKQNTQNIVGKLELGKEFGKTANLQLYNKISSIREQNSNEFIFNDVANFQNGKNRLFSSESKIVYTKKLDSSKAIVAVAKHFFQERPYDFTDENDVFTHITGNLDAQKINQQLFTKMNFAGAKISYLNKFSERKNLEIQLGNEYRNEMLHSEIRLYQLNNKEVIFNNSEFLNNISLLQNRIFAKGKYSSFYKNWKYTVNLVPELISSDFNGEKQTIFVLSPGLNFSYENQKIGNFSLFGNRRFSPLSMENLLQNYIYLGNRSFAESTLGFQLLPDYSVAFSYNLGDQLSKNLIFSVNYSRFEKFVSNNTIVHQNYSFNQSILVKDNDSFFAHLEARRYLRFIKSRFSLLSGMMASSYKNSINNQELVETKFSNWKIGFEMKSGWTKKFNYELGYDWTFFRVNAQTYTRNYTDQKGFLNLYYNFTSDFRIQSNLEYFNFGNTLQKTTQFLDIKVDYLIKNFKLNVFLKANNLLNSNSIQRFSITNVSENLYTQRLLPRHIVFGLNKNF